MKVTDLAPVCDLSCPECGSKRIDTKIIKHRFPYGTGDSAVELSACIPVRRCEECGNEFIDDEAEDLLHEATCHLLNHLAGNFDFGLET